MFTVPIMQENKLQWIDSSVEPFIKLCHLIRRDLLRIQQEERCVTDIKVSDDSNHALHMA